MQDAERQVAVGVGRHDDAETEDVVKLGKALLFLVHLAVDGQDGFLAREDAGIQAGSGKGGFHRTLHFLHQMAAAAACALDRLAQRAVAPGMQVLEGEVFQLAVGVVQAHAVGNGRVDFQCLGGDAHLRVTLHVVHGAHVVRAVGQLDQDHAHIVGHGQQHLAKGFGLVFLTAAELQLVQLGHAIHQMRHGGVEILGDLDLGDTAVFHGVVQQGGHQGVGVELPFGAQGGHGDRVGDVGLAALARHAQMRLVGKLVGIADLGHFIRREVVQLVQEGGKAGGRGNFSRRIHGVSAHGFSTQAGYSMLTELLSLCHEMRA